MSPATRYLTVPLLAAAVTLTLAAAGPGAGSAAATPVAKTVSAGRDFATTAFHDPWDFSNPSDVLLDIGPTQGVVNPVMSGGVVSFTVRHSGSYLSLLWGGYGSEVPSGREGTLLANMISAGTYSRLHMHIYVATRTVAALRWSTCGPMTSACTGTMALPTMQAGWNDIDQRIVRGHGKAWAGSIKGMRLEMTSVRPSVAIKLDSLRIYQPSSTATIPWSAPRGTTAARLWWTDTSGTFTTTSGQHAGPVGTAAAAARGVTNVAGFAPKTYFWSVAANGTKTRVGQTAAAAQPVIDSPSAAGCGDYATKYLGHPWTFTSAGRLAGHANATALSFTRAGELSATNAAPDRGDPNISLPIARGGINSLKYHRLTIVESYDGAFGLALAPGGGAMARVLWKSPGHLSWSQTAPLVTFSGKRTITVDMALPASRLTDRAGTAAQRYPFASANPITRLRYDPNEDIGARRWHLFSVRLAADCRAAFNVAVTWHDLAYAPGSTVRITARNAAGRSYPLGTTTVERAGQNSKVVSVRALPANKYTVCIYVTNPSGVTVGTHASGPLVIAR